MIRASAPLHSYITPHFQYGELALWDERRRFVHQFQMETAHRLCTYLEEVRSHFGGRPVVITSGHRPRTINRAVGGASGSEHLYDVPSKGAADVTAEGVSLLDLQAYIIRTWPYSVGLGAHRGFIHVGMRPGLQRHRWKY